MLIMSFFVSEMNLLTLDDSVSIESRTGMIASAVLSIFLTAEQSESLLFLPADAAGDADVEAEAVDSDSTLAIDPRPLERFCRRASKEESSWPTLLSGPTSSIILFMLVILAFVSSWRVKMDKVVAPATEEADSVEEVDTDDVDTDVDVDADADVDVDADIDADADDEEAGSVEEVDTEEELADTVDSELSLTVLSGTDVDAVEASVDADAD